MNVSKLLGLLPVKHIEQLEAEYKVDHQVKKLSADIVFKLILYSMLESNKISLRVMEDLACSATFSRLIGQDDFQTRHTSIRDRICTINADYFEQLFYAVYDTYAPHLDQANAVIKADSTVVGISAKLVDWTMNSGGKGSTSKHLKVSVALKGSLPCKVRTYTTSEMVSENLALGKLIKESKLNAGELIVFDRGVQARDVFDGIEQEFVGRLVDRSTKTYNEESLIVPEKPKGSTVTVISDVRCYLHNPKENGKTKKAFRVITATIDAKSHERIVFITNGHLRSCYEVAAIYKQRWEIEVFFKFLKQHLNLSHIVSRKENGVRVMIYMTLIVAILLLVYKKLNKIGTYKSAKMRFASELDMMMVREIVIFTGGDPAKAPQYFRDT